MESLFVMFGVESWKPALTAVLLPPVPLLVLVLIGARLILRRRGLGWLLVMLGVLTIGALSTRGCAVILREQVLKPPAALDEAALDGLRRQAQSRDAVAVVVLGGGRRSFAPEFGIADLETASLERLRYGIWLAKRTGAPLGFTGGVGWEARGRPGGSSITEAELAARIARQEFDLPVRWIEKESRDTRENAILMVAQLQRAQVRKVVLVTHAWHMPRALRQFRAAAGDTLEVVPAPMGGLLLTNRFVTDGLPTGEGALEARRVLRELLARVAGG
jgi:uncharacterized SAM-binding protein YcdF (DUF218 family)